MITFALEYSIEDKDTGKTNRYYLTFVNEEDCYQHSASLRLLGFKGSIYMYELETNGGPRHTLNSRTLLSIL